MRFGDAILALERGDSVRRRGWNGKGMYLSFTPAMSVGRPPEGWAACGLAGVAGEVSRREDPAFLRVSAHIDMRAADGSVVIGWLASQTDVVADDWELA